MIVTNHSLQAVVVTTTMQVNCEAQIWPCNMPNVIKPISM